MSPPSSKFNVYLEIGSKRVFAGAIDWPGWCRAGRDEQSALEALLTYGPRYARVLRPARLGFAAPKDLLAFKIVERLKGSATTDFGAPERAPSGDKKPMTPKEHQRCEAVLKAYWKALDGAVRAAQGKQLSKGPRGGGRALRDIVQHVIDSDLAYLRMLGWKVSFDKDRNQDLSQVRAAILEALGAAAPVGVPEPGPRGGARWTARYFVRRLAWHALDHAWEIEDRIL